MADFERDVAICGGSVHNPWDVGSEEMRNLTIEKEKASTYKYDSLFEPTPLTEHQVNINRLLNYI